MGLQTTDYKPVTSEYVPPANNLRAFQADSRRQPTSAVTNRKRNRLPSRRLLTGQTGLLVRNQVPAWLSFVPEIVGTDLVATAVSLNSSMVNAARTVGRALAGVLIVSLGRRLLPLQHGVVRIGHHRACRYEAVVDALDTLADVVTDFGRRDEHARATFDRGVDKVEEILAELREVVLVTPVEDTEA